MTLTVAEIIDLANIVGLRVDVTGIRDECKEEEYTITTCPQNGLDDEGTARLYRYVVYDEEYPEEGSTGLGPELKTQ